MDHYIGGVPPGCGLKCRPCEQDQREACWKIKFCFMSLDDIGISFVDAKRLRKRKS